jgi:hypothetical protein
VCPQCGAKTELIDEVRECTNKNCDYVVFSPEVKKDL